MLNTIQDSKKFVGEFKIDEHRGQLCIEVGGGINFYSYRGGAYDVDEKLKDTIRSFNLPEGTILDGGFLKLKKLGQLPYLYIFDILAYGGDKVWENLKTRRKLLDSVIKTKDRCLVSIQIDNFVDEFEILLNGKSQLLEKMAKLYNIEYELLKPLIEGFVIKDLNGIHSFPQSVKKSNNFYKLRLEDVM